MTPLVTSSPFFASFVRNLEFGNHSSLQSMRNINLRLLLTGAALAFCLWSCSKLPYTQIKYYPGSNEGQGRGAGWIVKMVNGETQTYESPGILLKTDGIGTVVIYDTLHVDLDGQTLDTITTIPYADFIVTQAASSEYSVAVKNTKQTDPKTWIVDVAQCVTVLGYSRQSKRVTLYADPRCKGLKVPAGS
jgi:hypothetical protein